MAELTWDGDTLTWDGEDIDWSAAYAADPAPPWPDDLFGTSGPLMLSYLPPLYEQSTYVRALLQAEGYELDLLHSFAQALPSCALPAACPTWAIPAWEDAYGLSNEESWSTEERRGRIVAASSNVVTAEDWAGYIGAMTRTDPADITVSVNEYEVTVEIAQVLSTSELAAARLAARRVLPVHNTLVLTGA